MADLRNMFAKKEPTGGPESTEKAAPIADSAKPNPFAGITRAGDDKAGADSLPVEAGSQAGAEEVGSSEPAAKPAVPGLASIFGTKAVGSKPAVRGGESSAALTGSAFSAGVRAASPNNAGGTGSVLDSLADLDGFADTVELVRDTPTRSQFADETPATAPVRELPDDIDKASLQFVDLIDGIYGIIHDTELLANVIRSIMIELKTYPQYIKLIAKDDVRTWVRAMRENMGLARIKKQEKKTSRGSGRASKSASDADVLSALDDLGIDFGNV